MQKQFPPALVNRIVFTVLLLLVYLYSFAQQNLEGQVRDSQTERPVALFSVQVDSFSQTFSDGYFRLTLFSLPAQFNISAPGYFPFEVKVTGATGPVIIRLIPENIDLQEVTIKAFQSDRLLKDTPGSIELVSNRQLSIQPSFTLAPVVNTVPGIWMQSGSLNTNRLTIRGIGSRSPYGSNKIRAYYGDIPLTNGVGETTLEDLELEQISSLEVIKGPASGFYGSGLGGVLLFNPAKPIRNEFTQSISGGRFRTLKYTGKLALTGRNSGHSLVYSRLHSDGYRQNNQSDRHNLTWTSSLVKNRTNLDLLASLVKMDAFIPSSIDRKTFEESPEKAAPSWAAVRGYEDYTNAYAGLSLKQIFTRNWQTKISVFGHYNKNNELRPFNILQEENHYLGFRAVLEKRFETEYLSGKLIAGDELFSENYRWKTLQQVNRTAGNLLSDNLEHRKYNNLFVSTDLNFRGNITLSASLNMNNTNYIYDDQFLSDEDQSATHRFHPVVSPRVSVLWKKSEKFRYYAVISHGFSPPTLEETLMPDGQRNTAIEPESGWNFEAGIKSSPWPRLYVEAVVYYMRVKNLLVARRTAEDAYMGINAGSTEHPGLEIKLDYKLYENSKWSAFLRANASLTRYRFADFKENETDYSGNQLTGSPSTVTNWAFETSHAKGYFLNLHFQTVGRIPVRDDNTLFTDAWQTADLMAGYRKSYGKFSLNLSAGIQNLADVRYASMVLINATAPPNQQPRYYYPGLPSNFKTTASMTYSF